MHGSLRRRRRRCCGGGGVCVRTHTVEVLWFSCKHYSFISASGQQQFLFNFYFSFFMTLSN